MAEISILNGYKIKDKKAVRFYDTVDDMKADITLKNGMHAKTKGYYLINDGGSAEYHITNMESNTDFQENLNNNLFANLIVENNLYNINKLGIIGDNLTDIGNKLNTIFNSFESKAKFYFPNGTYLTSVTIDCNNDFDLEFESSNAIIKAISEMDTLFNYNRERRTIRAYRRKIENGTFDGNDLANIGFVLNNCGGIELNHITIFNCKQIGFKGMGDTTESNAIGGTRVYDMVVRNYTPYQNSIGFYCNCSDSWFDTCVPINFETGFYNTKSNIFIKCHPWISFSELYEDSVAFYHSGAYSSFIDCIVDSIRTAFKNAANTKIKAINVQCYANTSFITQAIQEAYPFIFHDGTPTNANIIAMMCSAYCEYGTDNQIITTYHADSKFYNCDFGHGSNATFDLTNYVDSSSVTDQLASKNNISNINYNDYNKETKIYYVGSNASSTNSPSTNAGFLEVKLSHMSNNTTSQYVIQTFTEYTSGTKYERRNAGTSWTAWKTL